MRHLYFGLILFTFFIARDTAAQTRKIAYRSHSGNMSHFHPDGVDGFGMIIQDEEWWKRRDSIRQIKMTDTLKKQKKVRTVDTAKRQIKKVKPVVNGDTAQPQAAPQHSDSAHSNYPPKRKDQWMVPVTGSGSDNHDRNRLFWYILEATMATAIVFFIRWSRSIIIATK